MLDVFQAGGDQSGLERSHVVALVSGSKTRVVPTLGGDLPPPCPHQSGDAKTLASKAFTLCVPTVPTF